MVTLLFVDWIVTIFISFFQKFTLPNQILEQATLPVGEHSDGCSLGEEHRQVAAEQSLSSVENIVEPIPSSVGAAENAVSEQGKVEGSVASDGGADIEEQLPQLPEGLTQNEHLKDSTLVPPLKETIDAAVESFAKKVTEAGVVAQAQAESFAKKAIEAGVVVQDVNGYPVVRTGDDVFGSGTSYLGNEDLGQEWMNTLKKSCLPQPPKGQPKTWGEHLTGIYFPPLPNKAIQEAVKAVARGMVMTDNDGYTVVRTEDDAQQLVETWAPAAEMAAKTRSWFKQMSDRRQARIAQAEERFAAWQAQHHSMSRIEAVARGMIVTDNDGYLVVRNGNDEFIDAPLMETWDPAEMAAKTRSWFKQLDDRRQMRTAQAEQRFAALQTQRQASMSATDQSTKNEDKSSQAPTTKPASTDPVVCQKNETPAPTNSVVLPVDNSPATQKSFLTTVYENPGTTVAVTVGAVVAVYGGYKTIKYLKKMYGERNARKVAVRNFLKKAGHTV